jgi:hypothetical protein
VGHPVAVNAEPKLAAMARKRGWHVEHWTKAGGAPRPLLPLSPRPFLPGREPRPSPFLSRFATTVVGERDRNGDKR